MTIVTSSSLATRIAGVIAGFALVVSTSIPAIAQINVKGMGALTCSGFDQTYGSTSEEEQLLAVLTLYSWIEGYYSGKNIERPLAQQKELGNVVIENTLTQISQICPDSPNVLLIQVADYLYEQLPNLQPPADV